MIRQETLFDIKPKENDGVLETTEIEYIQLAFADGKKIEFIRMLERLCDISNYEFHQDFLFDLIKEKYNEKNNR